MTMPPPWLKCGICNRTFEKCQEVNGKVAPENRHVFQTIDQVRRQSRQKHLADSPDRHRPGGGR
jgi:hypothetical protein